MELNELRVPFTWDLKHFTAFNSYNVDQLVDGFDGTCIAIPFTSHVPVSAAYILLIKLLFKGYICCFSLKHTFPTMLHTHI